MYRATWAASVVQTRTPRFARVGLRGGCRHLAIRAPFRDARHGTWARRAEPDANLFVAGHASAADHRHANRGRGGAVSRLHRMELTRTTLFHVKPSRLGRPPWVDASAALVERLTTQADAAGRARKGSWRQIAAPRSEGCCRARPDELPGRLPRRRAQLSRPRDGCTTTTPRHWADRSQRSTARVSPRLSSPPAQAEDAASRAPPRRPPRLMVRSR